MMLATTIKRLVLGAIVLFSIAVLSISNSSALAEGLDPSTFQPTIEDLHGLQVTDKVATIVVTSTGCTKKEDFVVVLSKSQPPAATFIRLVPDFCRAAPRMYLIKFALQEVGSTDFTVTNLMTPGPGL